MVQHMVLWNAKEPENLDTVFSEMQQVFNGFKAAVPGLLSLEVYRSFAGYDLCLISTHESRRALEAYDVFPAHLEAKKFMRSVTKERVFCDFERD